LWERHQPPGVRVADVKHCPTCRCAEVRCVPVDTMGQLDEIAKTLG
jgi:hypothetical protein